MVPGEVGTNGLSVPSPVTAAPGPEPGSAGRAETTEIAREITSSQRPATLRAVQPGHSGAASLPAAGPAGED